MFIIGSNIGKNKDYSGFDRETWPARTIVKHREDIARIQREGVNPTRRSELESELGCRFSPLLLLLYFNVIVMNIIDPMHNLFLGTAKKMLFKWIDLNLITKQDMLEIQKKLDAFKVPSDVGRILYKFASNCSGFTADQWKTWTLVFSIYCLKGILPERDLECWRLFVRACRLLCCRSLLRSDVNEADDLLLRFCKECQSLYGPKFITPNMHLHCHLAQCVYDYGPVYGFWCFSFERYNGMLGQYHTNKRNIERTIMNTFCKKSFLTDIDLADIPQPKGGESLIAEINQTISRGTLLVTEDCDIFSYTRMSMKNYNVSEGNWDYINDYVHGKKKPISLTETQQSHLKLMYTQMYPSDVMRDSVVCPSAFKLQFVRLCSIKYGSKSSRSHRSSFVTAHWCADDSESINCKAEQRPGQIQTFFKHILLCNGKSRQHIIAEVKWYKHMRQTIKHMFGEPVEVWSSDNEDPGPATYIPVQRLTGKFVFHEDRMVGRKVLIVCPFANNK